MNDGKKNKIIKRPSGWLSFCIMLVLISIAAKFIDRFCWFAFLRQTGHTWKDFTASWKVWVEYITHFPGNILAILTFGIWIFLLIVICVAQIKERMYRIKPYTTSCPANTRMLGKRWNAE